MHIKAAVAALCNAAVAALCNAAVAALAARGLVITETEGPVFPVLQRPLTCSLSNARMELRIARYPAER
jgi:hypothetical protein